MKRSRSRKRARVEREQEDALGVVAGGGAGEPRAGEDPREDLDDEREAVALDPAERLENAVRLPPGGNLGAAPLAYADRAVRSDARRHVEDEVGRASTWHAGRERIRREPSFGATVGRDDLTGARIVREHEGHHATVGGALDDVGEPADMGPVPDRDRGHAVRERALRGQVGREGPGHLAECASSVDDDCGAVVALDRRGCRRIGLAPPDRIGVDRQQAQPV